MRYRAKVFVDATGDGDVAAAAGCTYMEGRDSEPADDGVRMEIVPQAIDDPETDAPIHMPITLGFSLAGMDCQRFFQWFEKNGTLFKEILNRADQKGLYVAAWYGFNRGIAPGVMGVNNGAWIHQKLTLNGLDAADLTAARRAGLRVAMDFVSILRENMVPGAETCTLERVGSVLGVRDTRASKANISLPLQIHRTHRSFRIRLPESMVQLMPINCLLHNGFRICLSLSLVGAKGRGSSAVSGPMRLRHFPGTLCRKKYGEYDGAWLCGGRCRSVMRCKRCTASRTECSTFAGDVAKELGRIPLTRWMIW